MARIKERGRVIRIRIGIRIRKSKERRKLN